MRRRAGSAVVATFLLLAGCGQPAPLSTSSTPEGPTPIVFAAASLSKVLPGLTEDATYSFDGSAALVDQLKGGAKADVFASADRATMDKAVAAGLIEGEPVLFATNTLVLVVPTENPGKVSGFDASLNDVKLVICSPEVPCGAATQKLAGQAGLVLTPVSEETKVTDVLGKVASGEADAGVVYATDAAGSDSVEAIEIPGADAHPNTYWVAVVKGAPSPARAKDFVTALSSTWQDKLAAAGFGRAP